MKHTNFTDTSTAKYCCSLETKDSENIEHLGTKCNAEVSSMASYSGCVGSYVRLNIDNWNQLDRNKQLTWTDSDTGNVKTTQKKQLNLTKWSWTHIKSCRTINKYIYIYIYVCIYTRTCIYIYIYKQCVYKYLFSFIYCVNIYLYMYVCVLSTYNIR